MAHKPHQRMYGPKIGLIMTTALASVALAGCTASAAPRAETSFNKAQAALEKGKADKAIKHAEAAVLAEPRNSGFRALLGAAYLEAGRFEAAATSFGDAIELGDQDPRTVLSYALAKTAIGDQASAIEVLSDWEGAINPADLGLAFSLAGKPERGVHVLVNALRSGQNSAKVRQNLAYSYALAGNWRGARVMAAEDVPADQLDARLSDWAATSKPEDVQLRVANLLRVQPSNAGGVPAHLALSNFPGQQAMVAEAALQADGARELSDADLVEAPAQERKPVTVAKKTEAKPNPTVSSILAATTSNPVVQPLPSAKPAPKPVAKAPVAKPAVAKQTVAKPAASNAPRFVSNAVVQTVPKKTAEERKAPRRVSKKVPQRRMAATRSASSDKSANTHMVQLGSFENRAVAKAKWSEFKKRFPSLKGHDVVITKAEVNGKIFYRLAAAGFGPRSARAMCGAVKSSGRGCFAYAKSNPPKGAIDSGVRIAARSR